MIITVTSARQRKMILWQSLHVEVNRDTTVRPAPAATVINTSCCPGSWMISRRVPRRMWRPPMISLPDSGWAVLPARPVARVDRCRRRTGCAAEGSGEHHHSGGVSGEPSFLC